MRLVWQWIALERELPQDWSELRLALNVRPQDAANAAALLGGLNPLRQADSVRLFISRRGAVGPDALQRGLLRLDRRGIGGTLELAGVVEAEPETEPEAKATPTAAPMPTGREPLAAQWDASIATLPADWSDMYAEIGLRSSDHLERAALLAAPLNPARPGTALALRFRVARRFGYGVSATMARRCLARLDEDGLVGEFHVLGVLCDTDAVATQGPVWRVGGKAV